MSEAEKSLFAEFRQAKTEQVAARQQLVKAAKGHEKISVIVAQCLDYGELQSFKQLLGKVRIEQ